MGAHSPGRFRKQGREAYIPDETNPEYHFNYPKTSWYYQTHYASFLEGWKEGEAEYEKEEKQQAKFEAPKTLYDVLEKLDSEIADAVEQSKMPNAGGHYLSKIDILKEFKENLS